MPPRGLSNIGNTCYMNSGLQMLFRAFGLSRFFLENSFENPESIANVYKSFINKYQTLMVNIAPKSIKLALAKKYPKYGSFRQEDSQEFLANLLDELEESISKEKKKKLSAIIDSTLESTLTCPLCGHISKSESPLRFCSLPIIQHNQEAVTLENLFKKFCHPERLEEGEEWKCEHCHKKVRAIKTLTIKKYSKYNIVHLKRFNAFKKINTPIEIPLIWNNRKLVSFVVHSGGTYGGHYYSYIYSNGDWYCVNDNMVNKVSQETIEREARTAYMFLFAKEK